jgi:glutathione synthase/RimK-type ligase-like ATP-grasp enzyme
MVVQRDSIDEVARRIGLPAVLKQPDSFFSRGVVRVSSEEDLRRNLENLLEDSELVIAQGYVRSQFDWRIGTLDNQVLYVCKYYLAPGDWRIINTEASGRKRYGKVETLPIECAPAEVIDVALRSARAIGTGLYGVDVKVVDGTPMVMEVNDNPTIESGCEDQVAGKALYGAVMQYFRSRLDARGKGGAR